MSYAFEKELIGKLRELDKINSQSKLLDDKKEEIRDQVRKWRDANKIDSKVTITEDTDSWIIDVYKQNRRNVIDYNVLINKLGTDANVFIKESTSEVLKITKR